MIGKDKLSAKKRKEFLTEIKNKSYELIVIGGGITGVGIALDATMRGVPTLLLEKGDFASGTSSKSTKLIHGGLRYLKQLELGLVKETGQERAIVHDMAPHLVVPEKMLLPLTKNGSLGKTSTSLALKVYDFLAHVEKNDKRQMLTVKDVFSLEPMLKGNQQVVGGAIYAEYRTDDARLVIELMKKATLFGADCINYVEVKDFIYDKGKISGVIAHDLMQDQTFKIQSGVVVNATGPWVDKLREKNKSLNGKQLHLTKGVHIVVPHKKIPLKQAVYFDVPDGRMVFAIPRGSITYIGTTDTFYNQDIERVLATSNDVNYLVDAVNNMFGRELIQIKDVVSTWAGLRPLIHQPGKSASEISRKDEIFVSESGLISIAGGKLTGFRKMAERVVDRVLIELIGQTGKMYDSCTTEQVKLEGARFKKYSAVKNFIKEVAQNLKHYGYKKIHARYLVHNYGTQVEDILDRLESAKNPGQEIIIAEALFCLKKEMVHHLTDFFIRRTGRLYFDIDSVVKDKFKVAELFASELDWDEHEFSRQMEELDHEIDAVLSFKTDIPLRVM